MHRRRAWKLVLVAFVAIHGRAVPVFAESVGSPSSILEKGQWVMGAGGGALVDRAMNGDAEASIEQVGHFRGYGLTEWLSLYGKIGWARIRVDDPTIIKAKSTGTNNDFGGSFLTSGQLKARLWHHAATGWELDGSLQYIDIRARHKGKNEIRWHEWQLATSVAKTLGRLKPYLGVKGSLVDSNFKVREEGSTLKQGRYEQDGFIGPFIGSDLYLGASKQYVINIESSYVNGAEVDVAVTYVF